MRMLARVRLVQKRRQQRKAKLRKRKEVSAAHKKVAFQLHLTHDVPLSCTLLILTLLINFIREEEVDVGGGRCADNGGDSIEAA